MGLFRQTSYCKNDGVVTIALTSARIEKFEFAKAVATWFASSSVNEGAAGDVALYASVMTSFAKHCATAHEVASLGAKSSMLAKLSIKESPLPELSTAAPLSSSM